MEERMNRGPYCMLIACGFLLYAQSTLAQKPQYTEEQVLARFSHEPSVQQVQEAAIKYYQVHPDRIRSLLRDAQYKALMPSISGRFFNSIDSTYRKMQDGIYIRAALPFKEDENVSGDSIGYSISATWDLDRLIFNAEVLDVQSLIGILDGVVREVTTVYYIRRRLQIDILLRPPADLASSISQRIRVEELTGLLDAMTGGYMSKQLAAEKK